MSSHFAGTPTQLRWPKRVLDDLGFRISRFSLAARRPGITVYVSLAAPVLVCLSLLIGPFQTLDEPSHFYRSVQLSEGGILPEISDNHDSAGGKLDTSVKTLGSYYQFISYQRWASTFGADRSDYAAAWRMRPTGTEVFTKFSNTVIYAPTAHAVPALAIWAARALGWRPLAWMYAGRLANSLTAVFIFSIAMYLFPEGRVFIFMFAFLPRTLFGTAALSADALLIPFAALYGAAVCRLGKDDQVSVASLVAIGIATIFICVGKIAYLPLVAVAPMVRFFRERRISGVVLYLCATSVITIGLWLFWTYLISRSVFPIRHNVPINIYGQLSNILSHPLFWLNVLFRTILRNGPGYIDTLIGGELSSKDTRIPYSIVGISGLLLVISAFVAESEHKAQPSGLLVALTSVAASIVAVFLLLYMQYTAFRNPVVDGVQGRYFLPLLPVSIAFFPKFRIGKRLIPAASIALTCWVLFTSGFTLSILNRRYWHERPVAGLRIANPQAHLFD